MPQRNGPTSAERREAQAIMELYQIHRRPPRPQRCPDCDERFVYDGNEIFFYQPTRLVEGSNCCNDDCPHAFPRDFWQREYIRNGERLELWAEGWAVSDLGYIIGDPIVDKATV